MCCHLTFAHLAYENYAVKKILIAIVKPLRRGGDRTIIRRPDQVGRHWHRSVQPSAARPGSNDAFINKIINSHNTVVVVVVVNLLNQRE